ncbi:MAG: hypothetical protein FP820_00880 [Sulfurimonas sp.]|nr:hypothetical protein [Sulfurimonas sp.]MBU3938797.1 hypothetical protein [bacterium]MBU4023870.1 hypothetical protein [bacterium]MBU4058195.1 hypothetical protein [bacterium]
MKKYSFTLFILLFVSGLTFVSCGSDDNTTAQTLDEEQNATFTPAPMISELRSRILFSNPYANIPAQCYIETSFGTQNACLFCHSNAAAKQKLGSTLAQAGFDEYIGNLQLEYAFGPADRFSVSPNINPWENTITPHKLDEAFAKLGIDADAWDMKSYIQTDNWQAAYNKKRGDAKVSNSGIKDDAFRLFPALNPSALPAQDDGFVRTTNGDEAIFSDQKGHNTGWRAVNFMPYGIFTPHTGSVSGIYIRLDAKFMQESNGTFSLDIYKQNLELLEQAIQDRIQNDVTHYVGKASDEPLHRGLFPLKTEFAHPLHYVDVEADGVTSKFPGTRSARVKEIRYMFKWFMHYTNEAVIKEENAPLYYNEKETWIDNGAGWWMSAFIEDANGSLRGQTPQELMQCVGCHSSKYSFEPAQFTSGTGNTIDTVWSFSRKFAGDLGWREMDYLGYEKNVSAKNDETAGNAHRGDPINRDANIGEYRKFLNHVVGASLYGDMPSSMEAYLKNSITKLNGYSADFPALAFENVAQLREIQETRLSLIREFTAKKEYLTQEDYIQAPLLYPTLDESLKAAQGYRKIVKTQRFTKGKDYFGKTIFTYKYYRDANESFTHIDSTAYEFGETITDRPYHTEETILWGVGKVPTLIDENAENYDPNYLPIFAYPQTYEVK